MKTIEVDWNSLEECKKLLNQVKARVADLKKQEDPTYISKRERNKLKFSACINIINTDISELYSDLILDSEPKYYVYAHCDPGFKIAINKDGISTFGATFGLAYMPFYIGKGTGKRAYELNRNETHKKMRQKIKTFSNEPKVVILKDGLTELQALELESKFIDIFGLIVNGGRLTNLDEGYKAKERRALYQEDLKRLSSFYKHSA